MHLSQLASAFGRCTGSYNFIIFSLLLLLTCFLELQLCMVLSSLPFLSYPRSHHRPVPNIIHSCTPLPQNCRPLFGVPAFIHGHLVMLRALLHCLLRTQPTSSSPSHVPRYGISQYTTAPIRALGLCPAKLLQMAHHDIKYLVLGERASHVPVIKQVSSAHASLGCGGLCYQSFLCVCRNVCEDMTLLLCTVCPLDAVCYVFCLFAAAAANTPDCEKGFIVFAQIIAIVCLQGLCSGWNVFVNCAVSSSHSIVLWWLRKSTHRFQEILHKGSLPYPVFRAR